MCLFRSLMISCLERPLLVSGSFSSTSFRQEWPFSCTPFNCISLAVASSFLLFAELIVWDFLKLFQDRCSNFPFLFHLYRAREAGAGLHVQSFRWNVTRLENQVCYVICFFFRFAHRLPRLTQLNAKKISFYFTVLRNFGVSTVYMF